MTAFRAFLALLCSFTLLAVCGGCDPDPNAPHVEEETPHVLSPVNEDFVLSDHGEALYADVVNGDEDEIHALYTDGPNANTLYYRLSTNRGRTWGPPINLLEGAPPEPISTIRILKDNSGLIFVVWKTLTKDSEKANEPEGRGRGRLTCRAMQSNTWSKAFPIGPKTEDSVYGWFACADASGKVQVIWNQGDPGKEGKPDPYTGSIFQADVFTAMRAHYANTVSPSKMLFQYPAHGQESQFSEVHYYGLHGYIPASGVAHWVAERQQTCSPTRGIGCKDSHDIVYWNGKKERVLSPISEIAKISPRLLVDAHGTDHIIEIGERDNKPCLLDLLPGTNEDPSVALTVADARSNLRGFQVIQGLKGEMAVMAEVEDILQGRLSFQYNLYESTYDGIAWSKTMNVTDTATRLLSDSGNGMDTPSVSVLSTHYAAGTYTPTGNALYLTLVAQETGINPSDQNHSEVHITTTNAGQGGSVIFRTYHLK